MGGHEGDGFPTLRQRNSEPSDAKDIDSRLGKQKKTPYSVTRRILSFFSGSWPRQIRNSGPPLSQCLVARRVLSYGWQMCLRTRSAAASAPPGTPDCNGVPSCAAGPPQSSWQIPFVPRACHLRINICSAAGRPHNPVYPHGTPRTSR